jgi:hypothetical protein
MRRRQSFGMIRDRAYQDISNARWTPKKELFLTRAGSGLVLLAVGVIIFVINIQNVASPGASLQTTLSHLPALVWIIGGSLTLLGFYWTLRNIWLLIAFSKKGKTAKPTRNYPS